MRQVALVAVVALAVGAAAVTIVQSSRGRAASLEQSRSQQEQLTRRLDGLERLLASAPGRSGAPQAAVSQGAPASTQLVRDSPTKEAAKTEATPEKRAEHAQRLQAANAMVDRGIQLGQWSMADMALLGAATNGLSAEERDQLMSKLTVAINSDQIKLDMRHRPGQ
jgi:hypothetical protein